MATSLTSIEPTASTKVSFPTSGLREFLGIRSYQAGQVAIAICAAEEALLDAQIVTILEHIAIIDECGVLGQNLDAGNAIHKVHHRFFLVSA